MASSDTVLDFRASRSKSADFTLLDGRRVVTTHAGVTMMPPQDYTLLPPRYCWIALVSWTHADEVNRELVGFLGSGTNMHANASGRAG